MSVYTISWALISRSQEATVLCLVTKMFLRDVFCTSVFLTSL